jgi:serine phosphatase RsbU (regulator of sigma subunit)
MVAEAKDIALSTVESTSAMFNGAFITSRVRHALCAATGGDWCEAFAISNSVIALSIGDVCGHGPASFMKMIAVRQTIRDAAFRGLDPGGVLEIANRFICEHCPGVFATAIFSLLDTLRLELSFANAGHPPPLVVGPGGSAFLEFRRADLPLGIEAGIRPALHSGSLLRDSLLVLCTDGVTEHQKLPLTGAAQLRDAAIYAYHSVAEPAAAIIEGRIGLLPSGSDDAAILTARTPAHAK